MFRHILVALGAACATSSICIGLMGCESGSQMGCCGRSNLVAPSHLAHYEPPSVVVKPGDTLDSIAKAHRVTATGLMLVNDLADARVAPGLRLYLPTH